ncbi:hypothetical protein EON65_16325 [archaeon]|nr:MAG: hypothetical protein EON65_16325 [archaeon]
MSKFQHQTFVALAIAGLICHFAISMENNDSRLMGVKKTEFKRVILDILHNGAEKSEETKEETNPELEPTVFTNSPRTLAVQAAQQQGNNENVAGNKKSKRVKHDSFYFLQKSLESRESPMSTANLRQRTKKENRAGEFTIPRKVAMDAEDLMFHDSYSETSQGEHRYRSKV